MKTIIKILSILIIIAFITDIGLSLYFFKLSVARTDKGFLANDPALVEEIPASTGVTYSYTAKEALADLSTIQPDLYNKQTYETVTINSFDDLRLTGYYLKAKNPSTKTVILAHGYSSQGTYMAQFAQIYYDIGYNVLLPDDRAHGQSEGNYIGFGWTDRKDYIKWIDFIIDKLGSTSQIVLHGVSMGGATVLMTSGEKLPSQVKAIVSDCAYTSVRAELEYQLKRMYKLPAFPLLDTTSFLSKILAGYSFEEASALKQVRKNSTPTLFIHGTEDRFVPTSMVNQLFDACSSEKELWVVPGAGHGTSLNTDTSGYIDKVTKFINKYTK